MKRMHTELSTNKMKDFTCPHCGMPIEDASDITESGTYLVECPYCLKDFEVKFRVKIRTDYFYNVKK